MAGIPFMVIGFGFLYVSFSNAGFKFSLIPVYLIPFSIGLIGAAAIFGRVRVIIDPARRIWQEELRFFVPLSKHEGSTGVYKEVGIIKEVSHGSKRSRTYYPVSLNADGGDSLQLISPLDIFEARRLAEHVARSLKLPLSDGTDTQNPVRRDYDKLDESVGERLQREGFEPGEITAPPKGSRCALNDRGHEVKIQIGQAGFNHLAFMPFYTTAAFSAFMCLISFLAYLAGADAPSEPRLTLFLFALFFVFLPNIITLSLALRMSYTTEDIRVSPRELQLSTTSIFGTRIEKVDANKVEEIKIPAHCAVDSPSAFSFGSKVTLITDYKEYYAGCYLSSAEIRWLKSTLETVLARKRTF